MVVFHRKRCLVSYLIFILVFGCLLLFYSLSYTTINWSSGLSGNEKLETRSAIVVGDHHFTTAAPFVINCSAICPSLAPATIKEHSSITEEITEPSSESTISSDLNSDHITSLEPVSSSLFHDYPLKWTKVELTQTTVFSAYYEEREEMFGPSVVLLGFQARSHDKESLYCLFEYPDGTQSCRGKSIFVEMDACNNQKEYHKKKLYNFKHVFHICRLSGSKQIPSKVALSHSANCNPSTSLISIYSHRPEKKANIGVCVETPIFQKSFIDVVNFIEMQRMFGAQVITLYLLDSPEGMEASLRKAYPEEVLLDIVHWSSSFKEKDPLHYYGEILAIHDCLYRNLHRVNYLALVDLDEVIVSRRHSNWHEMLRELDNDYVDSFIFINSVYLKTPLHDLPIEKTNHLKSLLCPGQTLPDYFTHYGKSRCRFHYYERSKVILKPLNVIDTDIHGPCRRREGKTHFFVPDDMATSQHYREKPTIECKPNRKTKKYDVTYDDWLSRFGPVFLKSVQQRICSIQKVISPHQ